jgi:hypothetical protein
VADIFNIVNEVFYRDEPLVFDEQHISSFKSIFIPRASGRDIFKALLEKAWFAA